MSNPIIAWVVSRLEEPSTWAGIAGLVASMKFWPESASVASSLPSIGMAFAAVLAVVFSEKK